MECIVCGKHEWKTVSQIGDLEIWACLSCGRQESVIVARLTPEGAPTFKPLKVIGKWIKKPSASDIKKLKLTFPDTEASDTTMLRHFFSSTPIELGVIPDFKMEAAKNQAAEAGIHVDFLPLSRPASEE